MTISPPIWKRLIIVAELLAIALWAVFVMRGYLDSNPRMVPSGNEFGYQSQSLHFWTQVQKCGWCALWNGSEQGGLPALVDVQAGILHPVESIPALLWGVANGSKVTVIVALMLAGFAQWWIAWELGLGAAARLYSAIIAVVGGHLASKMEVGSYHFILSAAMGALIFAGVLRLARRGGIREAILLGLLLGSFVLSGQGYLQLGMVGVLPAAAFLWMETRTRVSVGWRHLLVMVGLGVLLAGPLLVPMLHFLPNFGKQGDPGTFSSVQPLQYIPLNLVISDLDFYHNDILGKVPVADLYSLYIGWVPVILALVGFFNVLGRRRGAAWFLAGGAVMAFFLASGILARAATKYMPSLVNSSLVGGNRFPSVNAALAIPLVLALSAWGLDFLLRRSVRWPKLALITKTQSGAGVRQVSLAWLLLIPLILSAKSAYDFARSFYSLRDRGEDIDRLVSALQKDELQWVQLPTPFAFIEPAVGGGLKLSPGFIAVQWKGRDLPKPSLIATWEGVPAESIGRVGTVGGIGIYDTGVQYAAVSAGARVQPCTATGSGGQIDVACEVSEPGKLTVHETTWNGWRAWMDGRPVPLLGDKWLEVDAPSGMHKFAFRYLPWDVPIGLVLFVFGVASAVWLWTAEGDRPKHRGVVRRV